MSRIVANEYVFTYVIYTVKLALFTSLILYFCLRAAPFDNPVGYAVVFLSPAFILHSAYTSGSQDLQLLILMAISILFVRRDITLTVLSCMGVLVHELFILLLPAIFLLHTYRSAPAWQITKRKITNAVLLALPVIITILAVLSFGRIDVQEAPLQKMMAEKLPNVAHKHSWWGGYDELSYSLQDDRERSVVRSLPGAAGYIAIPVAYTLSLALVLFFYLRESSFFLKLSVFLVSLFLLFAAFFGRDFYRWVGMSANISLLLIVYLSAMKWIRVPVKVLLMLLAFSCFAPFGAAILERPFPAHQLLLDKFFT